MGGLPTILLMTAVIAVTPSCQKAPPPLGSGIDLAGMDTSVAPGDDFNGYANGGWTKSTPIPADKPSYGIGTVLADETRKRTQGIIQEAGQGANATADA